MIWKDCHKPRTRTRHRLSINNPIANRSIHIRTKEPNLAPLLRGGMTTGMVGVDAARLAVGGTVDTLGAGEEATGVSSCILSTVVVPVGCDRCGWSLNFGPLDVMGCWEGEEEMSCDVTSGS